jgi:hypothetical protein
MQLHPRCSWLPAMSEPYGSCVAAFRCRFAWPAALPPAAGKAWRLIVRHTGFTSWQESGSGIRLQVCLPTHARRSQAEQVQHATCAEPHLTCALGGSSNHAQPARSCSKPFCIACVSLAWTNKQGTNGRSCLATACLNDGTCSGSQQAAQLTVPDASNGHVSPHGPRPGWRR